MLSSDKGSLTQPASRSDFSDLSRRLASVGRMLAEARDPLVIYRSLRDFIADCLPFDTFLVTSVDPETGVRRCVYYWSDGSERDATVFEPLPANDTPASRALVADEPARGDEAPEPVGAPIYDVAADGDARRTRSVLVVPMASAGRVIGSIQLQSYEPGLYVLPDAVPLAAVADHAATALENLRLLSRLREEWLRTFDAMPDPVVLVDSNDRVRRANPAFFVYLGRDETVLGRPATAIFHDGDPTLVEMCEVCIARREGREGRITLPAGPVSDWRHLQVTLTRVEDPATGFVGMIEIIRDMTDLHTAEAAAQSRQAILDSMLSSTADGTTLLDLEGRFVWVNRAAERMLEVNADQLRGACVFDMFEPPERVALEETFERACCGEAVTFEHQLSMPGGRRMLLECAWAPVFEQGRVTGILCTSRDVTERRAALERAAEGEKLRALGQLASGVAHDFNNLLASILGNVQLVGRMVAGANPDLDRKLVAIERAARDGAETVRRIQNFTKVQSETTSETLRVSELFEQAVELSRPYWKDKAQARGGPVRIAVEPVDERLLVAGNGSELREVLTNLIINAVDAMPTGGTIRLGAETKDGRVHLSVSDTGEGIDDATRKRIFEPFFTTRGPKNSGLGLAVSYGIVTRHGGEIEVESQPGLGATFTLRFPSVDPMGKTEIPRDSGSLAARSKLLDIKVLVVDDDAAVREVVADALAEVGAYVTVVQSGEEALGEIERGRFDLLVTDLGMPGLNGWEVARGARGLQPEIRVLLLTGWGDEAISDGGDGGLVERVLAKPIDIDHLVKAAAGKGADR